ncbi:uncharacterized protein LOC105775253 isoform X2 [Gossypium raimondii]|uniref:uncharacterized protein LOC105775253 isoform X2 n=1 Tax=Gossypium raimondii TaxID=29730 RepID=UPI00063B0485|nr:uncharacterized protein LOC105775253 isoform X2 [Gossypium raimondii]
MSTEPTSIEGSVTPPTSIDSENSGVGASSQTKRTTGKRKIAPQSHSSRKKMGKERKKNCFILSFIPHAGTLPPFQLRLKHSKGTDGAPPLVPLARGRVQKLLNVGGCRDVGGCCGASSLPTD